MKILFSVMGALGAFISIAGVCKQDFGIAAMGNVTQLFSYIKIKELDNEA